MPDVMISPWVLPESPETLRWIDDATQAFPPAFGRGMTQRGSMADPRWGLRRRYRGLRQDQLAAIRNCLNESRGQLNKILVTPHIPLRGSFPATELFSNNTFASGTTGWTASGEYSQAVADRILRATRNSVTANQYALQPSSAITGLTQYASYVSRFMVFQGRGSFNGFAISETVDGTVGSTMTSYGMLTRGFVINGSTALPSLNDTSASGLLAGDYIQVPYTSFARAPLVDNGANAVLFSDQIDDSNWIKTNTTVTANAGTAPNGSAVADNLIENSSAGFHRITQQLTRASAVEDWCVYGYFKRAAGTRDVQLDISSDSGGSNAAFANFDLNAGTVSSPGVSGTATNVRAFIVSAGNGWWFCAVVGRMAASTQIRTDAYMLSTGTASYTGNGTSAIAIWRHGACASPLPTRGALTTSAASSGTTQTGSALYLKGLPASTSGLLEVGDWFEVASQLKQATARLNSDAAGLGYLQFRPALGDSPADNDPVIINQPFGRFIYSGGQKELENQFGLYGDIEMNLEEIYS